MGVEIERKFLVDGEKWSAAEKPKPSFYQQGYLLNDEEKNIRVRVTDDSGYLTVKGKTKGISRLEFEYAIPREDAKQLLDRFCRAVVSKHRYRVAVDGKVWEVDDFVGENKGLLVAEIELKSEDETFSLPDWVTAEVTADPRYGNSRLAVFPFSQWPEAGAR